MAENILSSLKFTSRYENHEMRSFDFDEIGCSYCYSNLHVKI